MRILLFPASYPPVLGGLQTVSEALAKKLMERNNTVKVVTNRYPRSLVQYEEIKGISVHRILLLTTDLKYIKNKRPDLFFSSLIFQPLAMQQLRRIFQLFQPEVVNVHFPDAQVPFILKLRKQFPFRLVVSLHGHEVERWFDHNANSNLLKQKLLLQQILRSADAVTACSEYLLKRATSLEPSVTPKGHIIHNGVDLTRFSNQSCYNHGKPYVFAYGRFTYKKGFDLLIEAFSRFASINSRYDLILAGDGENRLFHQDQVMQNNMSSRIHFFGRATPNQVTSLLNASSLLVIPSRQEPFGIVGLEALAAGKPILSTKVGGLPEFLDERSTRFVSPSAEEIFQGLVKFSEMPWENRLNKDDFDWNRFTWETVSERYETILRGTC